MSEHSEIKRLVGTLRVVCDLVHARLTVEMVNYKAVRYEMMATRVMETDVLMIAEELKRITYVTVILPPLRQCVNYE